MGRAEQKAAQTAPVKVFLGQNKAPKEFLEMFNRCQVTENLHNASLRSRSDIYVDLHYACTVVGGNRLHEGCLLT